MVVARVDEFQLHRVDAECPGDQGDRGPIGAEAVPADQGVPDEESVPGTLEGDALSVENRHPVVREELPPVALLPLPLRMPEPAEHHPTVPGHPGVGREDHVGEARRGVGEHDLDAEVLIGGAQSLPLVRGPPGVDGARDVHPGIDLVDHPEVGGGTHEDGQRRCLVGTGLSHWGGELPSTEGPIIA